jgi:aminoglycoside 3-N-acetyltransferase
VIALLIEALGPSGTLLIPALSYAYVNEHQPLFDPDWTSTCIGVIPETFRRLPGVMRSVHPTHSVCATGAQASQLLSRHHLDTTPVGPNSPFSLLPKFGGKILMLGCGLRPNTSMHGVEELVRPPYLFRSEPVQYVICSGAGQQVVTHKRHGFNGYTQRYDRIQQFMSRGLCAGRVVEADSYLIEAETMWAAGRAALEGDPLAFVEGKGGEGAE